MPIWKRSRRPFARASENAPSLGAGAGVPPGTGTGPIRIVRAGSGGAQLSSRGDLAEPDELARLLEVDLQRGVDAKVVQDRRQQFGPNELPPPHREGLIRRVIRHALDPMSLLLIVAAAVAGLALGEVIDSGAILAIVALNVLIAVAQEGRAARALEALRALETTTAAVIRDGRVRDVDARELVVGDLIQLRPGDRVPADARIVESTELEVDESLLTGESMPVSKTATTSTNTSASIGDRRAMAFSGTLITRGSGRALVVGTGTGTEVGAIAAQLGKRAQQTPLQRELRMLAVRIGLGTVLVAVFVVALVAFRAGVSGAVLERAFLVGVALAVAAVPEGLGAVTTVTLALGVRRMAERGGIVRRLPAVETLGATTVLAIDKTGTLTENKMQLGRFVAGDGSTVGLAGAPRALADAFGDVAALCSDAALDPPTGDPMEIALLQAVLPRSVESVRLSAPRVASIPFDSQRKRMTTVQRRRERFLVTAKGAPEVLLDRCVKSLDGQGDMRDIDRAMLSRVASELAGEGYRVIALAEKELSAYDVGAEVEESLVLIGLAALEDPVRPTAADAVRDARRAGMRIVMVTGDHPATARTVAVRVGLADHPVPVRTGAELRSTGLPTDPLTVPVYARVDPDQKLAIVERLQQLGHVVAVTGDGVNDAPALRRADIGVALGSSGTDVAREAADLVITDDDLATIVSAVREGRGIYANIRKVVDYLLACNLSEVMTVVAALVLFPGVGVPLLPLQLLWMNLVTDGLPALALGVDPTDPTLMDRPPRPRDERLLDTKVAARLSARAAVLALTALAGLAVVRYVIGHSWSDARAAMFTVLVWTQLLHVFTARRREGGFLTRVSPIGLLRSIAANQRLAAGAMLGAALQAAIVLWRPAGRIFGTSPFAPSEWVVVAALAALGALALAALPTITPQRKDEARRRWHRLGWLR